MSLRTFVVASALVALACSSEATPREPASVLIVDDSAGRIVNGAVPSPDGSRLVYAQVVDGGRSNVFVSDPDGGNQIRVSRGVWDTAPVWSPDGKWIAYAGEDPSFDLYIVASDGSAPARQVSSGQAAEVPTAWLSDGSGVVVNRTAVGDEHPVVISINGGPDRRIGPVMQGNLHGI